MEEIDEHHGLHKQLCVHIGVSFSSSVLIERYTSCHHQGYTYWAGRGLLWQTEEQGLIIAKIVQVLVCEGHHLLLVHKFLPVNNQPHEVTNDGILFVQSCNLHLELHLVPLLNKSCYQPCALIPAEEGLHIVEYV